MNRTDRISLVVVVVLTLTAAGSVAANVLPGARDAASNAPGSEQADTPPTADELAHAAARLEAKRIPFEEAVLIDLAGRYGLGGAVRVLAWANANQQGLGVEQITDKRDGTETEPGMGWGQIARDLGVHPGIGSIMGGGQGRETAPGQQKKTGE